MRANTTGLALSVGMGLLVLLMGFAVLSAAGLVGFAADKSFAQTGETAPADTVQAWCGTPDLPTAVVRYVPANPAEAEAIAAGDALFKNNCAQCHAVNDKVVGPALAGVLKRRSISWLVPWVKNSSKVIASGDEYAIKLFNDNGKQQMPAFPDLTAKEIKSIFAWVTQNGVASESAIVYCQGPVQ